MFVTNLRNYLADLDIWNRTKNYIDMLLFDKISFYDRAGETAGHN